MSRTQKTETLSLRLDPKTRFALEFISRIRGQSITTVVERAIKEVASKTFVGDEEGKNWAQYWDVSEGFRTLSLLVEWSLPTSFDEEELITFCRQHWQFFFTSEKCRTPRRAYVDILWPRVQEFQELWAAQKHTNYWIAGNRMAECLTQADVKPPQWPPGSDERSKSGFGPKESFPADLDDEIPF